MDQEDTYDPAIEQAEAEGDDPPHARNRTPSVLGDLVSSWAALCSPVTHNPYIALDTSHFLISQCIARGLSTGVRHLLICKGAAPTDIDSRHG